MVVEIIKLLDAQEIATHIVTILYKQMHRTLVTCNQMVGNNFGKWVPGKTVQDGTDHPKTSSRGPSPGARDSRQGI